MRSSILKLLTSLILFVKSDKSIAFKIPLNPQTFSEPIDELGISPSETVNVNVRKARSTDEEIEFEDAYDLSYNAFGDDVKIRVRRNPTDNSQSSIFAEDFEVLSINVDSNGESVFDEESITRNERHETESSVYVDSDTHTAVQIRNTENGTQLYGIVDGHSVIPVDEGHVVRRTRQTHGGGFSDYIEVNRTLTPMKGRAFSQGIQYEIEMLVFFDYDNSKFFKFNTKEIVDYILILFSSLNSRYATFKDKLKINFIISGIIISRAPSAQSFLEKWRIFDGKGFDLTRMHRATVNWVFAQGKKLPGYDLFALLTGVKTYRFDVVRKTYHHDAVGLGTIRGLCLSVPSLQFVGAVSVTMDVGGYWNGMLTVAHEIGHNLGSPHDGEATSKNCPTSDGYIMGTRGGENKYYFSSCSTASFKKLLESQETKCARVRESKKPFKPTALVVGDVQSLKGLCARRTEDPDAYIDPKSPSDTYCLKVLCEYPKLGGGHWSRILKRPDENIVCAQGKRCRDGQCVSVSRIGTK